MQKILMNNQQQNGMLSAGPLEDRINDGEIAETVSQVSQAIDNANNAGVAVAATFAFAQTPAPAQTPTAPAHAVNQEVNEESKPQLIGGGRAPE